MEIVLERHDLERAGRLALVFGMNVHQLLEYAGDILLSNKQFNQAITMYGLSRVRLYFIRSTNLLFIALL